MAIDRQQTFRLGVKSFLKDHGIKQNYIAKKAGISERTFNYMLNGNQNININTMYSIAEAVGQSPDFFMSYEPTPTPEC